MYSRNGNEITITISEADYVLMTLLLGVGIGGYAQSQQEIADCLKLMDRINQGNPLWSTYFPSNGKAETHE